ncbi:hypothetical protein ABPG75_002706 [Micractinium tetrahymenae]
MPLVSQQQDWKRSAASSATGAPDPTELAPGAPATQQGAAEPLQPHVAERAAAALALLSFPELEVQHVELFELPELGAPYLPGFLGFREVPAYLELLRRAGQRGMHPQLLLVDGSGMLHPRRCGSASHLGVLSGQPPVGVAKTLPQVGGIPGEKEVRAAVAAALDAWRSQHLGAAAGTWRRPWKLAAAAAAPLLPALPTACAPCPAADAGCPWWARMARSLARHCVLAAPAAATVAVLVLTCLPAGGPPLSQSGPASGWLRHWLLCSATAVTEVRRRQWALQEQQWMQQQPHLRSSTPNACLLLTERPACTLFTVLAWTACAPSQHGSSIKCCSACYTPSAVQHEQPLELSQAATSAQRQHDQPANMLPNG